MSPGPIIKARLAALVGGRVHAATFPQSPNEPVWPAIRFTVVSEEVFADLCGSEDDATDDVRVQVDAVAKNYDEMRTLKGNVIAAMAGTDPPCQRAGGFEVFDADTKTYRAVLEYFFQPSTVNV